MTQGTEARNKSEMKLPREVLILKFASILSFEMHKKEPILNADGIICCAVL